MPSKRDIESMHELVEHSEHSLNGSILVIVGTASLPEGLYVSLFGMLGQSVKLAPVLSAGAEDFSGNDIEGPAAPR
jgi:hypothetical protein